MLLTSGEDSALVTIKEGFPADILSSLKQQMRIFTFFVFSLICVLITLLLFLTAKREVLFRKPGWSLAVAVSLLAAAVLFYGTFREEDWQGNVLTLFVDNELYLGSVPVLEEGENIKIPFEAISDLNSAESFAVSKEKEGSYIDLSEIEENTLLHVYQSENQIYVDDFENRFDYSWTEYKYVAHAFGGVGKDTYTNSKEAFLENYQAGHRVFEVDFSVTSDDKLVAVHDWSELVMIDLLQIDLPENKIGKALTQDEFLSYKLMGKYTPLSFEDVVELMIEYPDIYIVTDTKDTSGPNISKAFQYMADTADQLDSSVLKRIIPQVYNEEMFDEIMGIYDWNSVIWTLYELTSFSESDVADFAYRNGIQVITVHASRATDSLFSMLQKRGIQIFMHTYNTEEEIAPWEEKGAQGFYTDYLTP